MQSMVISSIYQQGDWIEVDGTYGEVMANQYQSYAYRNR